jgi:hypothetical protein
MNTFGFYALGSAWLFALLAPLVVFYFLKLRRPRLDVPSLVLWRRVLEDRRVNSPFQRFKRNLLLLLQILLLALLAAAAMQPFLKGRSPKINRLPVLVDCSASMGALDKQGGSTRLDEAKSRVEKLIAGLMPDQEMCLISFSRSARRRTGFTNNRVLLRGALREIDVEDVPSQIEDALRMAQAVARSTPFQKALLLTDGNIPGEAALELSFDLSYERIAQGGPNAGITSLNARRALGDDWNVFVQIEGSQIAGGSCSVEVRQNDRVIATRQTMPSGGAPERLMFKVKTQEASSLEVRLVPDGFDSLFSDNTAFLDLPAVRDLFVFIPESLPAFRHAMATIPGLRIFPEKGGGPSLPSYDLVVSDRAEDRLLQSPTAVYVGLVPADLEKLVSVGRDGTEVVDWNRASELLRHVQMGDLVILDSPVFAAGAGEGDLESFGYEVVAHGRRGPLILERRRQDGISFHMIFHPDRSTLPYRVGFPVLAMNAVRIAADRAGLAEVQATRTGIFPGIQTAPGRTYTVESPDGRRRECSADSAGILSGVPCPRAGRYSIRGAQGTQIRTASLLDTRETNLAAVEKLLFSENISVRASDEKTKAERPLWRMFAMFALAMLMGEWWYYHRRSGG